MSTKTKVSRFLEWRMTNELKKTPGEKKVTQILKVDIFGSIRSTEMCSHSKWTDSFENIIIIIKIGRTVAKGITRYFFVHCFFLAHLEKSPPCHISEKSLSDV